MAKTLVIKNANYAENALDRVIFNTIPCTGISLDKSQDSIASIGDTTTITATVTPSDTSDNILWSSSDETVATVNNGIVTSVGLGTVTITATCGNYSATCSITVTATLTGVNLKSVMLAGDGTYASGNGLGYLYKPSQSAKYGSIVSGSGTLTLYGTYEDAVYYPIKLPQNTHRIEITVGNNIRGNNILLLSSTTSASGNPAVAQLVDHIPYSELAPVNGVISFEIPSHDGFPAIDAIAIGLQKSNSSEFTDVDFATITVEALVS